MLSAEREQALARAAQAGDQVAFDALVASHLRLVLAIAHEQNHARIPVDELVSEGTLGLVEAARRFDPERGVRLAAYAAWWIRTYVRRYCIANRRIVRPPSTRHGRKLLHNLRRIQRDLEAKQGFTPTSAEVAEALGVAVDEVDEMEQALSGHDVPCGPYDEATGAAEPRDAGPTPEAQVADAELARARQQALAAAVDELPQRERQIVQLRFLGEEQTSLASIGRDLGLSRERVRQLAERAEGKMRQSVLRPVA